MIQCSVPIRSDGVSYCNHYIYKRCPGSEKELVRGSTVMFV